MSTAQGRGPRRDSRLLIWTGHRAVFFAWAGIVLYAAGALSWKTPAEGPAVTVSVFVIIAAAATSWYHGRRLCERCIAETPLDPQAEVEKRMRVLRAHHSRRMRVIENTGFGIVFLCQFISYFSRGWALWALILISAVLFSQGITLYIWDRHGRLRPWCPWCHWGDGGNEEVSPDVPDPAVSR